MLWVIRSQYAQNAIPGLDYRCKQHVYKCAASLILLGCCHFNWAGPMKLLTAFEWGATWIQSLQSNLETAPSGRWGQCQTLQTLWMQHALRNAQHGLRNVRAYRQTIRLNCWYACSLTSLHLEIGFVRWSSGEQEPPYYHLLGPNQHMPYLERLKLNHSSSRTRLNLSEPPAGVLYLALPTSYLDWATAPTCKLNQAYTRIWSSPGSKLHHCCTAVFIIHYQHQQLHVNATDMHQYIIFLIGTLQYM